MTKRLVVCLLMFILVIGGLVYIETNMKEVPFKHEYVIDRDGHCYSRIYRGYEIGSFAYIPCPILNGEAITSFKRID